MTAAQTVEELIQSAQNNSVHAQLELAEKYTRGNEVEQSHSEALYWYQQAAQNGSHVAAVATAKAYLIGTGTSTDIETALFWLTKAAILGDEQAPRLLGEVYEQLNQPTDNLDLAQLWYQEAARSNPDAEQAYARVLEQQFNNRRAEQVATLDQLEDAFDAEQIELSPNAKSRSASQQDQNSVIYSLVTALIASLLGSLFLLRRQQQLKMIVHSNDNDQQRQQIKLEREIKRKDDTLKQQKRQLETLYRHVKKLQASSKTSAPSVSYKDNPLNLACALFGFSPSHIPDEKSIKLRYKQLSKIYHPDLKGSEEEMKRLNQALKVILKQVNK